MRKKNNGATVHGIEYLDIDAEGQDYIADMKLCQKYAFDNRTAITRTVVEKYFGLKYSNLDQIDSTHNYIDFEDRIIRKGATPAKLGQRLIIPLNMRDGSIIGIGKGNTEWNCSAPHGAGRIKGRNQAKKELSIDEFQNSMAGIYTTCISESTLDECPMSYKDSDMIINSIFDTVDIIEVIKPIYNFKA